MKHYDIVVCGGGIAGVAAALAASRKGKKVLLAEKQAILGGLGTSGLIYIYLPVSDDNNKIVTSGISEELLRRCPEYGPFDMPEAWGGPEGADCGHAGPRCLCCFSPAGYALTLEKMLREADVDLRLDTSVIGAVCDGSNRLTEAELFCASEREKVSADCFIDASGGAYLLHMAGAAVRPGLNRVSPWVMEMNDQPRSRYYFTGNVSIYPSSDELTATEKREAFTAQDMQKFLKRQYEIIRSTYDNLPAERKKTCYPLYLPGMAQVRKIACIEGMAEIAEGFAGVPVKDSVGVAADWRGMNPSWETPYGALVPKKVRGALAAGRCINTPGDNAWEVFRVIPAAAMTGEVAGTAAAMSVSRGIDPADLPVTDLQNELVKNGNILHIADAR